MEIRPDLEPWLASVFVDPEERGRGIGSQLVEFIMLQARERRFTRLYLFTPDRQTFYQRLGWRLRETLSYHETLVGLMDVKL
jgi:N-acetylglutamate synthase-like GNAT family acetyltransferase